MRSFLIGCIALAGPLMAEKNVLALSGSTREDSFNKKLVNEAAAIARGMGAKVTVIDLKDYPMAFYDGDLENESGMPENARKLRALLIQSDAVIVASPEYNASFSAVLKNAIDWTTRAEEGGPSRDAYKGKKFALMSASPGGGGGARSLAQLRPVIQDAGGEVIASQTTVARAHTRFNDAGQLADAEAKAQLKKEIAELLK